MKKIRFNLEIGDKEIRSMKDLENNFFVQDIYKLYQENVLIKWLELQGETEKVEQLKNLSQKKNDIEKIKLLSQILIQADSFQIEEYIQVYKIFEEDRKRQEAYETYQENSLEYLNAMVNHYRYLLYELDEELDKAIPYLEKELAESQKESVAEKEDLLTAFSSIPKKVMFPGGKNKNVKNEAGDEKEREYRRKNQIRKNVIKKIQNWLDELITHYERLIELNFPEIFERYKENVLVLLLLHANPVTNKFFTKKYNQELQLFIQQALEDETNPIHHYVQKKTKNTGNLWTDIVSDETYAIVLKVEDGLVGSQTNRKIAYGKENLKELLKPLRGILFKSNSPKAALYYIELGEEGYE